MTYFGTELATSTQIEVPIGYHPIRLRWLQEVGRDMVQDARYRDRFFHVQITKRGKRITRYVKGHDERVLAGFRRHGLIEPDGGRCTYTLTTAGWAVLEMWQDECDPDLSSCAFYRGVGTCSSRSCWQEPACTVDRPERGWPSERGLRRVERPRLP